MGLIIARTGPDLMSGENEQVASDYDGRVRLAPLRNLIPDPGMQDWNPETGKHRYWELRAARRPNGWAPFVRDQNDLKQFARQVTGPLPLSDHAYDIEELFPGASPVDKNQAADIAYPAKPRTKIVYMDGDVGFPGGYVTVAYGYILGDDWQNSKRVTSPGPRSEPFELSPGMGFLVATPSEIPSGATGIAFFVSEPKDTATAALTAPMYLTDRFRSRGIEQFLKIKGPLNMKNKFEGDFNDPDNDSFVGKRGDLAGLQVGRANSPLNLKHPIIAKLSYSVYTDVGISMSADITDWIETQSGRRAIEFQPRDFPAGVIGWRPEVRFKITGMGGNEDNKNANSEDNGVTDWYAITREKGKEGFFPKSMPARVYSFSPGTWHEDLKFGLDPISRSENDTTGLPAPAEPVEVVDLLDLNNSALTAGKHYIKAALFVGEDEGPASVAFATEDINHQKPNGDPASEAIRVFRPLFHNRMDNSEARERENGDIDIPRGWWIAPKNTWGANITVRSPSEGVMKYFDASNSNTDFNAFRTPIGVLTDETNRFNLRYRINLSGYQHGRVRVYIEEYGEEALYNDAASPTRTQLVETHGGNHEEYRNIDMIVSDTEPWRPRKIPIATSTIAVRLLVQGVGSGKAGTRNFDVEFSHFGFFEGWGEPRKQTKLERDRGDHVEPPEVEHPHGGYCVVRENPQDAPQYVQYTTLDRREFEGNMPSDVTLINSHPSQAVADVTRGAALYGDKGLRIAKTAITGALASNVVRFEYAPANMMSAQVSMYLRSYSNHNTELMSWRTDDGTMMAYARAQADGTLDVVYVDGAGTSHVVNVANNVEDGEKISLELKINSNQGTLKIRRGRTKFNLPDVQTITDIAWGTKEPAFLDLGYTNSATAALSDVFYDHLVVTDTGTDDTTPQQGNYIEYYGPNRTPRTERYGPTGLRVPVKPQRDYTISANMWYKDAPANTSALRVRAMSKKHEELRVYAPVINLDPTTHEEQEWERYDKTITTPAGTAYIEFFANGFSEGTVRLHGIQVEKGTVAHPFDMANARNGWFSVFFSTRQDGVMGWEQGDPVYELGKLTDIRNINVVGHEEALTSYDVEYRSANTFEDLELASYTNDWSAINHRHLIIETRVNLTSNDDFASPEIKRIEVDAERQDSHLCREDGTEYKGASLCYNVSAVHAPPRSENIELASGGIVEAPWGTRRIRRISFDVEVYRKSTVEEISRTKHHVLETPWGRYHITKEEPAEFVPAPQTRKYLSWDDEFFQRETATITGWITAEEEYA